MSRPSCSLSAWTCAPAQTIARPADQRPSEVRSRTPSACWASSKTCARTIRSPRARRVHRRRRERRSTRRARREALHPRAAPWRAAPRPARPDRPAAPAPPPPRTRPPSPARSDRGSAHPRARAAEPRALPRAAPIRPAPVRPSQPAARHRGHAETPACVPPTAPTQEQRPQTIGHQHRAAAAHKPRTTHRSHPRQQRHPRAKRSRAHCTVSTWPDELVDQRNDCSTGDGRYLRSPRTPLNPNQVAVLMKMSLMSSDRFENWYRGYS